MVVFNPLKKEIDIKIVYYGPALCGKTTNLQSVHLNLNPQQRGELISLATKDDRTLFFDFLPIQLDNIKGFKTRFHIYTVPGQVFYTLTRKAVLTGVDGVIFVADSQDGKMKENIESLNDLKDNLKYYNKTLDSIPLVFQYNKRDLPSLIPVEEMNVQLNGFHAPFFEASAVSGKGVMETLTMCCKMVLKQIQSKSKTDKVVGKIDAADTFNAQRPESQLPQLALVEKHVDQDGGVTPYSQASAGAAVTSEGNGSEGRYHSADDNEEKILYGTLPEERQTECSEIDQLTDREPAIEINQPLSQSMTSQGWSFKKENDTGDGLREKRVSLSEDISPPCEVRSEDGKRTCPRCSLKFKPNVKQCPICRINLVPEDKAAIAEPAEFSSQEDLHQTGNLEAGCGAVGDHAAPAVRHDAKQLEIISCGQPHKASSHAIKIPVVMRLIPGNSEVNIELTISFDNGVHE